MQKKYVLPIILLLITPIILIGCTINQPETSNQEQENVQSTASPDETHTANDFTIPVIVTGEEAREIFETNENVILLDVRNQDEFDELHIEGSILIPVGQLESRLHELPDKEAIIIVYCRAGRRSAEASEILISNGYKNIYDMQTIYNWE